MPIGAWMAALTALAVPNLIFAWRRRAAAEGLPNPAAKLSARQRERWAQAATWVWTIGTSAFPALWLLFDLPIEAAFFWSIVILGIGLDLLIVVAVVFAIVMSRRTTARR